MSRLRELGDELKEGGLISFGLSPERKDLLERAQSFMALLEGYAEHVMDAVGADLLEDLPAMRSALERRRREKSGFMRLLERLIGMDLKMRQYEQGKAFCDAVVAAGRDRGAQPRLVGPGGPADRRRARRRARLAGPHRAPRPRPPHRLTHEHPFCRERRVTCRAPGFTYICSTGTLLRTST